MPRGRRKRGGYVPPAFTAPRKRSAQGSEPRKRRTPEIISGPEFRAVPVVGATVPLRGCSAVEVVIGPPTGACETYRVTEAFGALVIEARGVPGGLIVRKAGEGFAVTRQEDPR